MNPFLSEGEDKQYGEKLQEHEARLVRILEALGEIKESRAWSSLKTEIFDDLARSLKREILSEAKQENPNTNKLNRLTGELKWADRFADLDKFAESQRVELKGVRQRLHGRKE